MALLEVKDLHTYFRTKKGIVKAVNGVSYSVEAGRTIGIVGESGSGKSVEAMSILRLLDENGWIESGEILFDGQDITKVSGWYHYIDLFTAGNVTFFQKLSISINIINNLRNKSSDVDGVGG